MVFGACHCNVTQSAALPCLCSASWPMLEEAVERLTIGNIGPEDALDSEEIFKETMRALIATSAIISLSWQPVMLVH